MPVKKVVKKPVAKKAPAKKPAVKKAVAKKPVAKVAAGKTVRITVGRFGEDPVIINVKAPATAGAVLEKAGFTVGTADKIWVNGKKATATTKVKAADFVSVVSPMQAGR